MNSTTSKSRTGSDQSASISIEGREIGRDLPAFLIAEVSANHDRDLDQALALVDIAAEAGWHSLKLQTYTADSLTMRSDHPSMRVDPVWGARNLHELYQKASMPMEFHEPLFAKARDLGLVPFTSVYDPRDLDFVEKLDCSIYKIASFEMTFDDLLRATAQTKKPIIMSTGMANLEEIEHAMEVLETSGAEDIVLLHCCSSYPAPLDEINLRAMLGMSEKFGSPVGFSDHTIGSVGPLAAIAMGAVAVEKHFTNDPAREGPDHRFSATKDILVEIAEGAKDIHLAKGTGVKKTRAVEEQNKALGRRSAFAQRDLPAGHVLSMEDYRFIRPGAGVPSDRPELLQNARLVRGVQKGHPIQIEDIAER